MGFSTNPAHIYIIENNYIKQSTYAALGICKQNIVENINSVLLLSPVVTFLPEGVVIGF